jgi:hypothetical protein
LFTLYNPARERLECSLGENCSCFGKDKCSISLRETPERLRLLFQDHTGGSAFLSESRMFPGKESNGAKEPSSLMIIPLLRPRGKPLGLMVLESEQAKQFQNEDLPIAESAAGLCSLAMRKSQKARR